MFSMLVDDDAERVKYFGIREILRNCNVPVNAGYEFVGREVSPTKLCNDVRSLNRAPDLAVIDYSLLWKDANYDIWNGDKIARFIRERWKNSPFYILFISSQLRSMKGPYDTLVDLLSIPYSGFVELTDGWQAAFEAQVRHACATIEAKRVSSSPEALEPVLVSKFLGPKFVGTSEGIIKAALVAHKISALDVAILITGETGTGKEVFANAIHRNSKPAQPFVAINCAAIAENLVESELFGHEKGAFTGANHRFEGKFVQANGGTLFLDEIGDLALATQAKVLRALQEKEVDPLGAKKSVKTRFRLISGTHRDLPKMIHEGKFRQDLYYRIRQVPLHLPALRERGDDVLKIAETRLGELASEQGKDVPDFTGEARRFILSYSWPGNVRQLENAIIGALALCSENTIDAPLIREMATEELDNANAINDLADNSNFRVAEEARQKIQLQEYMERGMTKTEMAEKMGYSNRRYIYELLEKHGLHVPKRKLTPG
jgi:DNA-binding NtrC family response regulator